MKNRSENHDSCSSNRPGRIGRRSLLTIGAIGLGGIALSASLVPGRILAAGGPQHLLLSCIDHRLTDNVTRYMKGRGLAERYEHVALAGAALGAFSDQPESGRLAFWEALDTSVKQHDIKQVCLLDHRDCDAYKHILGRDLSKNPAEETLIHGNVMKDLAKQIRDKYPHLHTEIRLMALDGNVQIIW